MRKAELLRNEIHLKHRIKELENLLCPAEQHEFVEVARRFSVEYGTPCLEIKTIMRMVCRRCYKTKEVID